ncbi:hypothetical protein Syun_009952 [Stephania yunnanensis]|uniref:Uncharacterized protein n=1 Tax=Stephania yunnanensis TaxID=152371 RepID=A0AAP0PP61_9MAGN
MLRPPPSSPPPPTAAPLAAPPIVAPLLAGRAIASRRFGHLLQSRFLWRWQGAGAERSAVGGKRTTAMASERRAGKRWGRWRGQRSSGGGGKGAGSPAARAASSGGGRRRASSSKKGKERRQRDGGAMRSGVGGLGFVRGCWGGGGQNISSLFLLQMLREMGDDDGR